MSNLHDSPSGASASAPPILRPLDALRAVRAVHVSALARALLTQLVLAADNATGCTWPLYRATLAAWVGCSVRQIARLLRELVDAGIVEVCHRPGAGRSLAASVYALRAGWLAATRAGGPGVASTSRRPRDHEARSGSAPGSSASSPAREPAGTARAGSGDPAEEGRGERLTACELGSGGVPLRLEAESLDRAAPWKLGKKGVARADDGQEVGAVAVVHPPTVSTSRAHTTSLPEPTHREDLGEHVRDPLAMDLGVVGGPRPVVPVDHAEHVGRTLDPHRNPPVVGPSLHEPARGRPLLVGGADGVEAVVHAPKVTTPPPAAHVEAMEDKGLGVAAEPSSGPSLAGQAPGASLDPPETAARRVPAPPRYCGRAEPSTTSPPAAHVAAMEDEGPAPKSEPLPAPAPGFLPQGEGNRRLAFGEPPSGPKGVAASHPPQRESPRPLIPAHRALTGSDFRGLDSATPPSLAQAVTDALVGPLAPLASSAPELAAAARELRLDPPQAAAALAALRLELDLEAPHRGRPCPVTVLARRAGGYLRAEARAAGRQRGRPEPAAASYATGRGVRPLSQAAQVGAALAHGPGLLAAISRRGGCDGVAA